MANLTSDNLLTQPFCGPLETFQEVYTYSTLSLSVAGSLLNIVCLTVLVHPELDNVFTRIRILLASCDLVYLASDALYRVATGQNGQDWKTMAKVNLVILTVFSSGSAYSTVALAVERCFAMFFPFKCKDNNVNVSSRRRVFAYYLFPVVFFSLLHNLATLMSPLSSAFSAYTSSYQPFVIALTILRFLFYISANLFIFSSFQRSFRVSNDAYSKGVLQMLVISISSIILHVFWITYLISGQLLDTDAEPVCQLEKGEPVWYKVLLNVTDFLWVANSAQNFFIYNFIGDKFGNVFRKTYCLPLNNIVEDSNQIEATEKREEIANQSKEN